MLYAVLSVFLLLTVLLAVINGVNFSMTAQDADILTRMIAQHDGKLGKIPDPVNGDPARGPMGPKSPEMNASLRYFTFRFNKDGKADRIAFNVSAFSEDEAKELALSLCGKTVGWTRLTYRYRVYNDGKYTYVTVIDQGRELLPSYRILLISLIGELVGVLVSFAFLALVGRRLFKPLVEADRKQKRFISEAESSFKVPLTVVNAGVELIERDSGPTENTVTIRRQVGKMTELVNELGSLAIYDETPADTTADLSAILSAAAYGRKDDLSQKGFALNCVITPSVAVRGSSDALMRVCAELMENAVKFASGGVDVALRSDGVRTVLTVSNPATLDDGSCEQAFDRFTRLSNADGVPGHGLGLSFVRDAVRAVNGRSEAWVKDGVFTVCIKL